ncbi:hypothetical protein RI367_004717 [Sorochytrium milnesiophthora]
MTAPLVFVLLLVSLATVYGGACVQSVLPQGIQRNVTIQPVTTQVESLGSATIQLFGYVDYANGCTIILRGFKYYPALLSTKLYGVKGNGTNGFPVSSGQILGADGSLDLPFTLDQGKNLSDFNVLRLFSEQSQVVVGEAKLYDLPQDAQATKTGSTSSASAVSVSAVASALLPALFLLYVM